MNLSGDSVAALMRFFQIEAAELLAVHDELEMPLGSFGFKMGGGLGGHNGLRSLEARLGTRDFARLRFGIGRPDRILTLRWTSFRTFPTERERFLDMSVFPRAAEALLLCLTDGFPEALARFPKVKIAS